MNESESGFGGTLSGTETQVIELTPEAPRRCYEATAVVRDGEGLSLLIPSDRKRLHWIIVHASTDLLYQILEARGDGFHEELAILKERNQRQSDTILQQAKRLRTAEEHNRNYVHVNSINAEESRKRVDDAERRLTELQDAYVARGEELESVRQEVKALHLRAEQQTSRVQVLSQAIWKVLNPTEAPWKTVHAALRSALASEGYHPQTEHGFFSWARWFGCPSCVPEWQMYPPTELSNGQAAPVRAVVAALQRDVAAILRPAFLGDEPDPKQALVTIADLPPAPAWAVVPHVPATGTGTVATDGSASD